MRVEYKEFKELNIDQVFRARGKWWKKSGTTNEARRFDVEKKNSHSCVISTFFKFELVAVFKNEFQTSNV